MQIQDEIKCENYLFYRQT